MVKWIRTEEERKQILIDQAWFHLTKMIGALLKSERERKNALLRVEGRMKVALGLFGMDPPSELPEPSTWPAAKKLTELEDDQSFTTLFTTQDIRLLVENIWSGQSSITMSNSNDPSKKGKRPVVNYDDLLLTRWDPLQPLSPWNCVLLTRKEAVSHDHNAFAIAIKQLQAQLGLITDEKALTESFYKIYSPVFLQRVQTKHIEAKNYFGSIVSSAALLHKQFDVPQKNDKEQEEVVVSEESASASRQKISEAQTTVAAQ
jgi:hypothetical protein